jgi:putative FmdB family regulatory protein
MPIYEYACKACGHETEIMHKISDPTPKKCPECGKPKLIKQMSATGFRLGGGGWYETDFKSGNKRNVAEKSDAGAACTPTGCEKPGCAATPEAKAEAKKSDGKKAKPAAKAA